MTYGDLPKSGAVQPQMACSDALEGHGVYSAQAGDYFWADPAETVLCECGEPMVLVRHVDYYEVEV